MKKYLLPILLIAALISIYFAWQHQPQSEPPAPTEKARVGTPADRIGPDSLYPNARLTPGEADTLDAAALEARYAGHCPHGEPTCTYSQDHRNVDDAGKIAVYNAYNVPRQERNARYGEVDHFYPLCAGGSNNFSNLWYQPATNEWKGQNFGYHQKDLLEAEVCREIKTGRLSPDEAYTRITSDWVKFYLDLGLDKASIPILGAGGRGRARL